jgi:rare lipoprotein A
MITGMRALRLFRVLLLAGLLAGAEAGCVSTAGGLGGVQFDDDRDRGQERVRDRDAEVGKASFYARRFHGRSTASGETYDESKMTAAHRTLPFGTRVRVTNLENGRAVTLRVNDRGPHRKGRVIDVSYKAAKRLGFVRDGIARVKVEVASKADDDDDDGGDDEDDKDKGE